MCLIYNDISIIQSNPIYLHISKICSIFAAAIGGIAQLARASALQAEGRRFDSDYLHQQPTQKRFWVGFSFWEG